MAILIFHAWAYTVFTSILVFACCVGCFAASGLGLPLAWSILVVAIMCHPVAAIPNYMRVLVLTIGMAADVAYIVNYIVAIVRCMTIDMCPANLVLGFGLDQFDTNCDGTFLFAVVLVLIGRVGINFVYQLYSVNYYNNTNK
jgi:hypothetical protein